MHCIIISIPIYHTYRLVLKSVWNEFSSVVNVNIVYGVKLFAVKTHVPEPIFSEVILIRLFFVFCFLSIEIQGSLCQTLEKVLAAGSNMFQVSF